MTEHVPAAGPSRYLGPWVGEFSYEMAWWAPRLRRLRRERFPHERWIHIGYPGREILYRDFVDEYAPYDPTTLGGIGEPAGAKARDGTGPYVRMPSAVEEFLRLKVLSRPVRGEPVHFITPFQIEEHAGPGEGCSTIAATLNERPYGDYARLEPRAEVEDRVRERLRPSCCANSVAVFPRWRMRGKARDGEDWSEMSWRKLVGNIVDRLGFHVFVPRIRLPRGHPGLLPFDRLIPPGPAGRHVTEVPIGFADSVEEQIALLRATGCSIFVGTGAAMLPLFAGTPVFTVQSEENVTRMRLPWQRDLAGATPVEVVSVARMGRSFWAMDPDELLERFRAFVVHRLPTSRGSLTPVETSRSR